MEFSVSAKKKERYVDSWKEIEEIEEERKGVGSKH